MVQGYCSGSTWKAPLSTQAKTAEWDEILSSSQRFAGRSFQNGGWGESVTSTVDPCCVVEIGVRPLRATIIPFHHICVGEVAAGWCATYSTWLKAEQLDI